MNLFMPLCLRVGSGRKGTELIMPIVFDIVNTSRFKTLYLHVLSFKDQL